MKSVLTSELKVKDKLVKVMRVGNTDYISLTDLAKYQNSEDPSGVIRNWMSNKDSFAFYSLWEELNNDNFKAVSNYAMNNKLINIETTGDQ